MYTAFSNTNFKRNQFLVCPYLCRWSWSLCRKRLVPIWNVLLNRRTENIVFCSESNLLPLCSVASREDSYLSLGYLSTWALSEDGWYPCNGPIKQPCSRTLATGPQCFSSSLHWLKFSQCTDYHLWTTRHIKQPFINSYTIEVCREEW